MAFGYPVLLELEGRRAVVIGELAVEAGKVEGLLVAGAEVTVVAKGPAAALDRLDADPRVVVHRRGYGGPGDLAGAVLCVAHAAEPAVRDAIAADARAAGVLVNVMDDVPNCDFAAPAIVRRGDLVVAVGTGGRAPALASRLRAELGERFGPDWAELVDVVGRVRAETLPRLPDFEDRSRRWKAALDLEELERLVEAGQADEAATRLRDRLLAGLPGGCGRRRAPHPGLGYAPPPGDPTPDGGVPACPGSGEPAPEGGVPACPGSSGSGSGGSWSEGSGSVRPGAVRPGAVRPGASGAS
jgi:siroheme synthase-like protein